MGFGRWKSCVGDLDSALSGSAQQQGGNLAVDSSWTSLAFTLRLFLWRVPKEPRLTSPVPGCVCAHGLARSAPTRGFLWADIC